MTVRLLLHVRRAPDRSRLIVGSVDFPRIFCEAESFSDAVRQLRPQLVRAAIGLDAFDRSSVIFSRPAELLRIPVSVPRGKKGGESIELTLGVVVTEREDRNGRTFLVRIPAIPDFDFVVRDMAQLPKRVA